jgi:hypothetical protein
VWEATVDGRELHFHLAGINNQNFIMRDAETGSWWQQVTGEAILGPLKGRHLTSVFHDELSFQEWKREKPGGRVLQPDERVLAAKGYAPEDWEARMNRVPVVSKSGDGQPLGPRDLVIGITLNGISKAYSLAALQKQSPVTDSIGGVPLFIMVGEDNRSVRAFERTIDGRVHEFFKNAAESPLHFLDAETGSVWDFTGKAIAGPLAGTELRKIAVLEDYWFDWHNYHPEAGLYNME